MVVFSLTLVRHGETSYNRKHIIQGQTDVPLSSTGIHQAKLVGGRLKNDNFTQIFASDLARAHQTAQAIFDINKVCSCDIIRDKRLRERKFGSVEGHSFQDLAAAASKANSSILQYTPAGAETVDQLRERARTFFKDLCKLSLNYVAEIEEYVPAPVKVRSSVSTGKSQFTDVDDAKISQESKRRRHEPPPFYEHGASNPMQNKPQLSDNSQITEQNHSDINYNGDQTDTGQNCVFVSQSTEISNVGNNKLTNGTSVTTSVETKENTTIGLPNFPLSDRDIKRSITMQNTMSQDCPNVSLSPLLEHRLSSISSIGSGRNSFDDTDDILPIMPEVLVVTHGGWLKELFRHFVEDLNCKIPGGKSHALRIGPNASVSKFTVSITDSHEVPTVTCLLLHDKDHLFEINYNDAPGTL
ncbi:hypothetical protein ScPMuIL_011925 [Solemya velum]